MTDMPVPEDLRARNLRTLGVLAALFLLPLLAAAWMYYGTDWRPAARVNHGVLISPVRPLASPIFRDKWSLVYVGSGACDEACRQALYVMRQTRIALNTDMTRVARVFIATGECCARDFLAREHPGLIILDASASEAASESTRLLGQFPPDDRAHTLFIVDPLGNLMMSYDARQNPRGLLEDLRKLLRLSHIG
jgi:hypothetical protein